VEAAVKARFVAVLILVPVLLLAVAEVGAAQPQAPGHHGATVTVTVQATVPAILRVVMDPTRLGPDGAPVAMLVTNIPELRRNDPIMGGELVVAPTLRFTPQGHPRGGADAIGGVVLGTTGVIRYTVVTP